MNAADDDEVEQLLRRSAPRPVPAASELAAAKAAIRTEWIEANRRRSRRRSMAGFGIAASLLAGVMAIYTTSRVPAPELPVATIERAMGSVNVLGEGSTLLPVASSDVLRAGQTLVTESDTGVSLAWAGGGSVRVDENTRLQLGAQGVLLERGRLYFDSESIDSPIPGDQRSPQFAIETSYGRIEHVGTQYMAAVDSDALVVSVREGEVAVTGGTYDQRVGSGQQATFSGRQRPVVIAVNRSGAAWAWASRVSPAAHMDGRSLHDFLIWVTRELGLDVVFEGDTESVARNAILKGNIDAGPRDALRLRLATAALDWRIEDGVIYISD